MVWYMVLSAGATVAALAKTLAYASLLGPDGFGVVALVLLVTSVGSYPATIGIQDGLSRQVPVLRGRGEDVRDVRSTAVSAVALLASGLGLVVSLITWLASDRSVVASELVWAGPFLAATVTLNIVISDLQSSERSVEQAGVLLIKSVAPMATVLLWPWSLDASRVVQIETVMLVLTAVLGLLWCPAGLRFSLHWATLRDLVRTGGPFALSSLVLNLSLNVDRWAVQLSSGVAVLGMYGFAMQLVSVGLVVVNISQLYLSPRWLRSFSAKRDVAGLLSRMQRRAAWTTAGGMLAMLVILFLAPRVIEAWWPSYLKALPLLPWIGVGTIAVTLGFFDILFLAAGNGRPMVGVHAVAACVTICGCGVAVWVAAPIAWFAVIFACGRVLTAVLGWTMGRRTLVTAVA